MSIYYRNRLDGVNWYKTGLGVSINEGGRGPVFTWLFGKMIYFALWLTPKWNWRISWK